MDSSGKRLVEAVTGDTFWSSGLPPYLAASTHPQCFPGSTQLGVVLESIRGDLMKEIVLSKLLGVDDDVPGSNSIVKTVSDNELLLPSPLLQDLPTDTEVNQPVPTDTALKPTPLSTKFSPPNHPHQSRPFHQHHPLHHMHFHQQRIHHQLSLKLRRVLYLSLRMYHYIL